MIDVFYQVHGLSYQEKDLENIGSSDFELSSNHLDCFNAVINFSRALSQFRDSADSHIRVGLVNGGKRNDE
eukprot:SAG25_NODE_12027_length_289_cov_1.073684_1_plen_71_part_00